MARKPTIFSFPIFLGGIFPLDSVCYVVVHMFSLFSSLFEEYTAEKQSVTDSGALLCAVTALSKKKLRILCSGSSDIKCRQILAPIRTFLHTEILWAKWEHKV